MNPENFKPKKELSIDEIRTKRNNGEEISPEDYLRLKEHDMQEDREDSNPRKVIKIPKPTRKPFLKGYNNFK